MKAILKFTMLGILSLAPAVTFAQKKAQKAVSHALEKFIKQEKDYLQPRYTKCYTYKNGYHNTYQFNIPKEQKDKVETLCNVIKANQKDSYESLIHNGSTHKSHPIIYIDLAFGENDNRTAFASPDGNFCIVKFKDTQVPLKRYAYALTWEESPDKNNLIVEAIEAYGLNPYLNPQYRSGKMMQNNYTFADLAILELDFKKTKDIKRQTYLVNQVIKACHKEKPNLNEEQRKSAVLYTEEHETRYRRRILKRSLGADSGQHAQINSVITIRPRCSKETTYYPRCIFSTYA